MSRLAALLPAWLVRSHSYAVLVALRRARQQRAADTETDRQRRALYGRWLGPGALAFDIGANLGNRTRIFAELGARVVALEPQAHCRGALRWQFLFNPRVRIVGAAVARDDTPRRIQQFDTDVLSSLNPAWIETARASGRFGSLDTVREVEVPCVTLDQLIARFGRPAFTKIDVEGFEAEVLAGLTQVCGTVSFEVTPEMPGPALECVSRLEQLGYRHFQFSPGESMTLTGPWLDGAGIRTQLAALATARGDFGDIYALAPGLAG